MQTSTLGSIVKCLEQWPLGAWSFLQEKQTAPGRTEARMDVLLGGSSVESASSPILDRLLKAAMVGGGLL